MDEGERHPQQDIGNDNPEEGLPTYNYLEAQERDNPNSRFGRWRSWVEKRAAERYADVSEDDLQRQRQRGWGTLIDTSFPGQAPPLGSGVLSPMSSQVISERMGDTRLSVYQFGSRFIPHSSSPIRSLVPLNDDRYLLLGGMDGLGLLDIFPDNVNLSVEDTSMLHALESAARRDLWTGEAIYQMAILESYPDATGNLQGVLLALVGSDDAEDGREPGTKNVRMYNLASIWSLVKWVSSHPDAKPLEIQGPRGWTHQQSTSRRLHRPNTHNLTKSLKAMAMENNDRPRTPTGSVASMTAVSVASERSPPPKHQESQDSADSWDMVDDLPLRWASDYVNLASVGSKLANAPVSFFELWKNEGVGRTTSMLAVATKGCILLYETPKGERSFKFVKEFFTPLPAKSVNFVQTTSTETVKAMPIYPEGEKIKKERPLSKLGHDSPIIKSPRARRLSIPGDHTYGSQLSLFVVFEKRACLIRIADSAVSEIELWDDGGGPPSPTSTASLPSAMSASGHSAHGHSFRKSIQSLDAFGFAREGKGPWLPMLNLEIPYPPPINGEPPVFTVSKTVLLISRGRRTHILPSPLPTPLSSQPPLRVIRWHSQPRQVAARLSTGPEKEPRLQVLGFTDQGVEIVETGIAFIFKPPDLGSTIGKGKGKVKSISVLSEPLVRATWESPDVTGYLGRGGYWHTLDTTSGRPELRNVVSDTDLSVYARSGSRTELGQGIYAWTRKGLEDYRVVWLGDASGEQV